jgi:hypothetical protein
MARGIAVSWRTCLVVLAVGPDLQATPHSLLPICSSATMAAETQGFTEVSVTELA